MDWSPILADQNKAFFQSPFTWTRTASTVRGDIKNVLFCLMSFLLDTFRIPKEHPFMITRKTKAPQPVNSPIGLTTPFVHTHGELGKIPPPFTTPLFIFPFQFLYSFKTRIELITCSLRAISLDALEPHSGF